jgi:hypothetical protein
MATNLEASRLMVRKATRALHAHARAARARCTHTRALHAHAHARTHTHTQVHRAARMLDAKDDGATISAAMAKRFTTDHCFKSGRARLHT